MKFSPEMIHRFSAANHIVVLTGAGISAESGVPTFRDAQTGLWAKYRPEDLATPEAFRRHPRLVWKWYAWRRELIRRATPNPGHLALARLEGVVPALTVISQNVDDLHARAGSRNVVRLHGDIFGNRCSRDGRMSYLPPGSDEAPPKCLHCGALVRPDVVWFGEQLNQDVLQRACDACADADLFLSVGTSALVQPAASLPLLAKDFGAWLVEVNPAETTLTSVADTVLTGSAARILPVLVDRIASFIAPNVSD